MAYISDRTGAEVDATLDAADTHHARTDNPHSVTKSQVGLGNAENTADIDKPITTAQGLVNAQIAVEFYGLSADFDALEALLTGYEALDEQSGAIVLDFLSGATKDITLTADAVFTTLNRAPGRSLSLRIVCDATANANLTFPAWLFLNASGMPTAATFPKEAILSLTCYGYDDTDIRAVWLEEP